MIVINIVGNGSTIIDKKEKDYIKSGCENFGLNEVVMKILYCVMNINDLE